MTRTAFVAAAMLAAAMGSASAGSDHYGADGANQPAAGADHMMTSSIREGGTAHHQALGNGRNQPDRHRHYCPA